MRVCVHACVQTLVFYSKSDSGRVDRVVVVVVGRRD